MKDCHDRPSRGAPGGAIVKKKPEDRDTRYFLDLDLRTGRIIGWDYGQRQQLVQVLEDATHQRVFLTKGQYRKLESRAAALSRH